MAAVEVLKIIYKFPRLGPKDIHAKRTLQLSQTVYNILVTLRRDLKFVKSENGKYTITPLGSEHYKFLQGLGEDGQ